MRRLALFAACLLFSALDARAESVALIREGGTFVVPVLINDRITLKFTVDSGAADVSIPADVFSTLIRAETVSKKDFIDTQVYTLADGSEQRSRRFRIRSLRLGNLELRDVVASVAPTAGSLLLGQSFLARLRSWSFDNERHLLLLNEPPGEGTANLTKTPKANAPRSASGEVHDEARFLRAVAIALYGDDSTPITVSDREDCIFQYQEHYQLWVTVFLNNVDPSRIVIKQTPLDPNKLFIRFSGVGFVAAEQLSRPSNSASKSAKVSPTVDPFAYSEEYVISRPYSAYENITQAWAYIYAHGCRGRRGS